MKRKPRRAPNGAARPYRRRSDNLWVAQLRYRGRRYIRYGTTAEEAALKRDQLRTQLRQGAELHASPTKLWTVADWIREYIAGDWAPHTRSIYRSCLKHIEPTLGFRPLHEVNAVEVGIWLRSMAGIGDRIRQISYDLLNRSFKMAVRQGLLPDNPCSRVDRPRYTRQPIQPFDAQQVEQILREFQGHRLAGVLTLIFLGCLRQGEVFALTWADVDWTSGILAIRAGVARDERGRPEIHETKTVNSVREIPLPPILLQALLTRGRQAAQEQLQDCPLIFPTKRGTPVSVNSFAWQVWKPLLKRLGLKIRGLHAGRHTAATLLLRQGVPLHTVSKIMGHSDPATTARTYAHVLPGDAHAALSDLAAALSYTMTTVTDP